MLRFTKGDILQSDAEALVNTVNTVGVMGKGIALQFKRTFPENFKAYEKACKLGEVMVGKMFVYERNSLNNPVYIFNFPTKKHWKGQSKQEYIELGLIDLVYQVKTLGIQSIAIPPLGCGNGGLDWIIVREMMIAALELLPDIVIEIFEPHVQDLSIELRPLDSIPNLTPVKAALLCVFRIYQDRDGEFGRTIAQKLAYFLQNAGFDLKLKFSKANYGPYAKNVDHILTNMEGYFIEGVGDLSRKSSIRVIPSAYRQLQGSMNGASTAINNVSILIDGFESRYGLELLSSVHWVMSQEGANDLDSVIEKLHSWDERKKAQFSMADIRVAWEHLTGHESLLV